MITQMCIDDPADPVKKETKRCSHESVIVESGVSHLSQDSSEEMSGGMGLEMRSTKKHLQL